MTAQIIKFPHAPAKPPMSPDQFAKRYEELSIDGRREISAFVLQAVAREAEQLAPA